MIVELHGGPLDGEIREWFTDVTELKFPIMPPVSCGSYIEQGTLAPLRSHIYTQRARIGKVARFDYRGERG